MEQVRDGDEDGLSVEASFSLLPLGMMHSEDFPDAEVAEYGAEGVARLAVGDRGVRHDAFGDAHEDVFGVRLAERILVLDELDARCAVLVEEALPVLALFEAGPPDV